MNALPVKTIDRQHGAALVVSLILLLILTVLGVASMSSATVGLAMAGNAQFQNRAFEAADSMIEAEITRDDIAPLTAPGPLAAVAGNINRDFVDPDGNVIAVASGVTLYDKETGAAGWQLGGSTSFKAYHFDVVGAATSARGAAATHQQGYYVIGPGL